MWSRERQTSSRAVLALIFAGGVESTRMPAPPALLQKLLRFEAPIPLHISVFDLTYITGKPDDNKILLTGNLG